MSYCIMRIEKRQQSAVYGLQIEANRTQSDHENGRDFTASDIQWALTPFNMHLVRAESWSAAIKTALADAGVRARKNAVVLLDGFYGASRDWFVNKSLDEIVDYFKDCLAFHEKYYGKVINAVIHFDEATPHLQVASIPLVFDESGTRLSAKDIMGNRQDYRKRQDLFHAEIGQKRGMERGESHAPENTREHLTVLEYKKEMLEQENDQLRERSRALQKECKALLAKNQQLQDINQALAQQVEQPFLHFCMMEFIRNAKVRDQHGEIRHIADGFECYMERNIEALRGQWEQQFAPPLDEEHCHEHEYEQTPEYDEWER